ncbi:putative transcriptional regulatory protein [Auxenochlorella protothecoides]|uniref:Putative transcriptional regulatory protein n=2 Tax=Auxenochlorella protothecoides TaxID=3075 RepID=A0A087SPG3_AUXPR|nr:putative transcriptional regulatory protein [Auxenochlorella protothecoides]KFM27617.1 putative transcriptional regulatory protein [Auxenochlorella protothecoides]RMZ56977.1 hypothetical protein APUTEX25_005039 [Auxenochlorella protothecoides]|eukprot:RMZ56977.1 hypothetical protein APUTEX25_005039 [Auxenochlorella protothecoides]
MMGRRSAKIALKKGKADGNKAKLYGKLGKLIAQAARAGGPDPVTNMRLREVLHQAKLASLPNDIVTRNLEKATDKSAANFSEVVYECYGPGGTGYVIESLTDNTNRSASTVRAAVTKAGGKMADPGSVLFAFARQGVILVGGREDDILEAALEAGAQDVLPGEEDGEFKILTAPADFAAVCSRLAEAGIEVDGEDASLAYLPSAPVDVGAEAQAANEVLMERLLAVDDVDAVYTNCAGLA